MIRFLTFTALIAISIDAFAADKLKLAAPLEEIQPGHSRHLTTLTPWQVVVQDEVGHLDPVYHLDLVCRLDLAYRRALVRRRCLVF